MPQATCPCDRLIVMHAGVDRSSCKSTTEFIFDLFLLTHSLILNPPLHRPCAAVRELLTFYEFNGDEIEIVPGSALHALNGTKNEIGRNAVLKLMEAVERSIPTPVRETEKDFLMPVEDTFSISGRGTVVTGRIETGTLKVGDDLEIIGIKATAKSTCTGT